MYKHVIAIDLETTGIDPLKDHIMEIGASVMVDGEIVDNFQELVKPEKMPPLPIQKLTGITPDMLTDARSFEEVFPEFMKFLEREDALYLAHNASFDRLFLMTASKDIFQHRMMDTIGLSRIMNPTFQSHALGFLAEQLDLPRDNGHRALSDCHTTLHLWQKIMDSANEMPLELVSEINHLISPLRSHPYREFFRRLQDHRFPDAFGKDKRPFRELFKSHTSLFEQKVPERELDDEHGSLDLREIDDIFSEGGKLANALTNFESREGQVQMAVDVADCFNRNRHFMVEAPTGIGKSLAYLVPAALFSAREGFPVVVSTNTKNLQSQLFEKDLPLVKKTLGLDIKTAIIKGRGNYLCLRKLMYVLDSASKELDRDERMQMVTLLNWAVNTKTGDISECVLNGRPNFPELWSKLRTIGDECMGRGCANINKCFLRRARTLALQSDVVVANHALVFAEMNMESAVLPDYRHIVFDEAHNLEAAATDHLSVEVGFYRVMQVLTRLHRPVKRGKKKGTGLINSILAQLEGGGCTAAEELVNMCQKRCEQMQEAADTAMRLVHPFFETLSTALPQQGRNRSSLRFCEGRKRPSTWEHIMVAKESLVSSLAGVMRGAEGAVEVMREMPTGSLPYLRDFQRELEAVVQWLREVIGDVEFVLAGTEANYVYWIESCHPRQGGAVAKAAPLSVAELLYDQVYCKNHSCIFSSATMTVREKFKFLAGRLGISLIPDEKLHTLRAPSPFDYDEQCIVAVPTFLAEPDSQGSEKYVAGLSQMLEDVFRRSRGRAMALFTSYSMLKSCFAHLQKEMQGDGITILAQGESGSREHITSTFTRDIHSVLLGTHSFWEGVDVQGEALSCLAIARLPFGVFTDPVIEARCEQLEQQGKDPFIYYSLPSAVIRFKQGFGRLIRSRSDRGIVIIADRRVVAKRYGKIFLDSLPTGNEVFTNRDEFLSSMEEFFKEEIG